MQFQIIAAFTHHNSTGYINTPLYSIENEKTRFQALTLHKESSKENNVIIIDKNTYKSISKQQRSFKGRTKIVISHKTTSKGRKYKENITVPNLDSAMYIASSLPNVGSVFLLGSSFYQNIAIEDKRCIRVYITLVKDSKENYNILVKHSHPMEEKLCNYSLVRHRYVDNCHEHLIYERKV